MGKRVRATSPAMERGLDIHKKAENYVNGKITGMPKCLLNFKKEFVALRRAYKKGWCSTEPDISMSSNLKPSTSKKTDFFIGFADLDYHHGDRIVIDYKTGKRYPGYREQGHAYSTCLLAMNSKIEFITVEFWYLDIKEPGMSTSEFVYTQDDLAGMLKVWNKRIDRMYADTKFTKTPYQWCRSCPRNKNNGGDCSA